MLEINLKTMTLQEAADYSLAKLVEQGRPCREEGEDGKCMYSDDYENMSFRCAVGHLLPDDSDAIINPNTYKTFSVSNLCDASDDVLEILNVPQLIFDNEGFFTDLQKVHDHCGETPQEILMKGDAPEKALKRMSEKYGIDIDKPQYKAWVDLHNKFLEQRAETERL